MIILSLEAQKECLTESDIREVIDTLWDHRAKWRLIGIQMGIKPGDLDAIGKSKSEDVEDALYEVTKQWLRSANPKPDRVMLTTIIKSKCIAGEFTSAQGNKHYLIIIMNKECNNYCTIFVAFRPINTKSLNHLYHGCNILTNQMDL